MAVLHRLLAGVRELLRRRGDADLELELDHYLRATTEQKVVQTMGIPILQGRGSEPSDATSSELVVIVNKTLAETFWKGRDPIGQRLRPCCFNQPWATVVGVAADVKQGGIDKKAGTEIYSLLEQSARRGTVVGAMHVVLRTTAPFEETGPFTRAVVREIDPTVPIVGLREMDQVLQESIRRPRLLSHTVSIFAGLALLIAVIGTYGLLSYTVANRRREIGIRLALGASRGAILAQILRWGGARSHRDCRARRGGDWVEPVHHVPALRNSSHRCDNAWSGRRRRHGRGRAGLLDSRVERLTVGPVAARSRKLITSLQQAGC